MVGLIRERVNKENKNYCPLSIDSISIACRPGRFIRKIRTIFFSAFRSQTVKRLLKWLMWTAIKRPNAAEILLRLLQLRPLVAALQYRALKLR